MELTIRVSKKGTRVVKASELHRALGLADHHYQVNVRSWVKDVYQFADGIRKPVGMQDYARARHQSQPELVHEYYFNLELARLVALSTKSKVKQAVATKLLKEEQVYPENVQLSAEQTLELLEQTKAMTRLTCQMAAEDRHYRAYVRRTGSGDYWNRYRLDNVTKITMEGLRAELEERGIAFNRSHRHRELLMRQDAAECIRVGIVDHYAAQGFSIAYANQLGKLARELASTMKLEVTDDRQGEGLFTAPVDDELVRQLQRVAA